MSSSGPTQVTRVCFVLAVVCVLGILGVYLQLSHSTHNSFAASEERLKQDTIAWVMLSYDITQLLHVLYTQDIDADKKWEVTSHKYFASVLKQNFKVLYFTSIFICLTCLVFVVLTFLYHIWYCLLYKRDLFNAFEGSFYFTSLNTLKHQIDLSLNEGNSNTWKAILLVYFI